MSASVLVIQHEAACPAGFVGRRLQQRGLALDIRQAHRGEPLPATVREHDALVVLGGEHGATDDDIWPWLPQVRTLIREAVSDTTPFLGICLGLQLACVALGGSVGPNPAGRSVGVLPIALDASAAADPLFAGVEDGSGAAHWNLDIATELPAGATVLGRAAAGWPEIVRLGPRAWGLQFHPEVTPADFAEWGREFGDPPAEALAAVAAYAALAPELSSRWRVMTDAFADIVRGEPPATVELHARR